MIKLVLPDRVIPKARPRSGRGHCYLPRNYRIWKSAAILAIRAQWGNKPALDRACIKIAFIGKHRGDLDNLAGAILDALVAAQVLTDDRISVIPHLELTHTTAEQTSVTIELTPIEVRQKP